MRANKLHWMIPDNAVRMYFELPITGPDKAKLARPKSQFSPGGGFLYPCFAWSAAWPPSWTYGPGGSGDGPPAAKAPRVGGDGQDHGKDGGKDDGEDDGKYGGKDGSKDDGEDDGEDPVDPLAGSELAYAECPHTAEYRQRPMKVHRDWLYYEPQAKRRRRS